jgi:sterol desaturase/sphingolipid hydroxylase (fatty acid hydroxylase superfamily)
VVFPDLLAVGAAALIFLPLERLLPLHGGQKALRRGLDIDVLHLVVSGVLIRAGAFATMLLISIATMSVVPAGIREAIRSQPDWIEFVELLVLSDLGFYIAHRTVHAVPWLWRFHEVHHSSEQLDWLATYRVHPVDQIFNSTVIAVPAIVLGFSATPLVLYAVIYRWHSIWLHSNVGISVGPLGKLFATPHFHHWHHADEIQAHDRNFGGQFVIWDRLFGTAYVAERLPNIYGVGGNVAPNYLEQVVAPFRPLLRREAQAAPVFETLPAKE